MPDIGHSAFLQSLGWALINSLWQLALLWVVYQVIFSLRTQATPQVKSATATLLLCTGFGWFLFTFVDHLLAGSPATVLNGVVQSFTSYNGLNDLVNTVLPIASVTYLLLLFIPLVRFARNYRFVNQLRSQGIKKIDVEWRLFVNRIAQQLGIKKPVHIYISDLVTSPVTIGYLKPLILVPVAAVNRLSTSQVEAILLHELAHIKRHDYLVNLVITFIHTILYFNPFVRLFIKNIEREREKSCDLTVMHFQYDPHGYASALLTLEKTNMASHIAMAASGKKNDLLHRIEVIMGIQKSVSFSFYKLAGVFAGLVCILALQALFIMSKPQKQVADDFALLNVTNPWYFFMGNDYKEKEAGPASELPFLVTNEASRQEENIPHTAINVPATPTEVPGSPIAADPDPAPAPEYIYVNSKEILAPELTPEQEMQVEEIIENSKEVLEKAKWSQIEQEMADAVTSDEKLLIYEAYLAELEKVNWDKMEERLKLSVENVDLNKMSQQLQTEINVYKMDSLVKVYNTTLNALDRLESYVITNQSQEVIHPELTVELIQAKKKQMAAQSEKVRAIRDRKIIRL